jgi:hypothetical protein
MANAVKSRPGTKEFREKYDLAVRDDQCEPARVERPHHCERCGKRMRYADQECGCTARDPWLRGS